MFPVPFRPSYISESAKTPVSKSCYIKATKVRTTQRPLPTYLLTAQLGRIYGALIFALKVTLQVPTVREGKRHELRS